LILLFSEKLVARRKCHFGTNIFITHEFDRLLLTKLLLFIIANRACIAHATHARVSACPSAILVHVCDAGDFIHAVLPLMTCSNAAVKKDISMKLLDPFVVKQLKLLTSHYSRPTLLFSSSFALSIYTTRLRSPPSLAPSSSRTDEVGMIYARHAEASVTVCLMHWSSLDPLLPPHPASSVPLPSAPRHSSSCRSATVPSSPIRDPTLSSSSTAVKAARSRGNRVHPRARKSDAR